MPRVDDMEQLGRRDLLVVCWNHIPEFFGMLPPKAQWELHRLYGPGEGLTDEEVLGRIRRVLLAEPSLTQRAGKHYSLIFASFKSYADQVGRTEWEEIRRRLVNDYARENADPTEPTKRGRKPFVLMPVMRPDVDTARTARIFLDLADRIRDGKGRPIDRVA